ncbi:transposase, IS116/IS110/IS902 family [Leptospira weilii str. 2006001853]|uniref:Transposase, IS116/IS110/IS902 family n=1 Tax=Leptospira weilii str. 2006001853 TaxID=1001589 RepID=A0A828YZ88_9LEPT|nr:transposase, IS116/IS110/IS902 family [Leptospira weilii str. 2006001853]
MRLRSKNSSVNSNMFLLCEVYDFKRFRIVVSFMSFLGLVPGEYASERKQIGVTKIGSPRLRRILTKTVWRIVFLKQKVRS